MFRPYSFRDRDSSPGAFLAEKFPPADAGKLPASKEEVEHGLFLSEPAERHVAHFRPPVFLGQKSFLDA